MAPSELISFWLPYQCICYMLWEFFSIIKKPHMISRTKALAFMSAAVKVWAETNKTKNHTVPILHCSTNKIISISNCLRITTISIHSEVLTGCLLSARCHSSSDLMLEKRSQSKSQGVSRVAGGRNRMTTVDVLRLSTA